jgi:prevent-host-death family protein
MRTVGIRELKNNLSRYLRLVKEGEEILITDRGTVVASLGPPERSEHPHLPAGFVELARQGRARLGRPNDPALYRKRRPLIDRDLALEILAELRGDR